jgi:hypothetical protein
MDLSLQSLADRAAIYDLLVSYCYAVDDRDWHAYSKVFIPDAVIDDTVTGGVRSGVADHVVFMKRALAKIRISQHAISTIRYDIRSENGSRDCRWRPAWQADWRVRLARLTAQPSDGTRRSVA